jgi:hypothetical protein
MGRDSRPRSPARTADRNTLTPARDFAGVGCCAAPPQTPGPVHVRYDTAYNNILSGLSLAGEFGVCRNGPQEIKSDATHQNLSA